jgi:hypothetical protein
MDLGIIGVLQMIITLIGSKLPWLPAVGSAAIAGMALISLLIELVEVAAALTATTKDDALIAKAKLWKSKIIPILEVLPHANIPIAAGLGKIMALLSKAIPSLKAAIEAWKKN